MLKSAKIAVIPPTSIGNPVVGTTSVRRRSIRWLVASSCGPVVGTTCQTATSLPGTTRAGLANCTPSVAAIFWVAASSCCCVVPLGHPHGEEQRTVEARTEAHRT